MPSIRIRKNPSEFEYDPFVDGDIEASSQYIRRQRSMGTFPRRGLQTQIDAVPEYKPRMRSHTTSGVPYPAQLPAPYSSTPRSRSRNKITEHILAPRRSFLASPPSHGTSSVDVNRTIRDGTVTLQGSQANIAVMHTQTGDRTPAIVESIRSVELSQQFDGSDLHHHDDIVDHLDAIGIMDFFRVLGFFLSFQILRLLLCRVWPMPLTLS